MSNSLTFLLTFLVTLVIIQSCVDSLTKRKKETDKMAQYGSRGMSRRSFNKQWRKSAGKQHRSNQTKPYGGRRR